MIILDAHDTLQWADDPCKTNKWREIKRILNELIENYKYILMAEIPQKHLQIIFVYF